jgi:hypothetical protein
LDEAELLVGDSLLRTISSAIEEMDYLAVLLSPASVSSPWVSKELELAITRQLNTRGIKVLPIVISECEIPGFLHDTFYVRMDTEANYASGLRNLMRRLLPDVPYDVDPDPSFSSDAGFDWVRNPERRADLLSKDADLRKKALQTLKNSALIIPMSLELLADPVKSVVRIALDTLKKQSGSESFLVDEGRDQYIPFGDGVVEGNTIVHYEFNWTLSAIYDYLQDNRLPQSTIVKLLAMCDSRDETVRAIAFFTLTVARVERAIPKLISAAINEETDLAREIAVWGLGKFSSGDLRDPRLRNALLLAATDLVGNVRSHAIRWLAAYDSHAVTHIAESMLYDPSAKVAKQAIAILGGHESDSTFRLLSEYLDIDNGRAIEYLRPHAVIALSYHQRPQVTKVLLQTLRDFGRVSREWRHWDREVIALSLEALGERRIKESSMHIIKPYEKSQEKVEINLDLEGHGSHRTIDIGAAANKILAKITEAIGNKRPVPNNRSRNKK